jgi:signal transduction histidine kinase
MLHVRLPGTSAMPLSRPNVLILSTDAAFAREVAARWPTDPNSPKFTVLDEGLFRDRGGSCYDLAIADAGSSESRLALKQALAAVAKPAILVQRDIVHRDIAHRDPVPADPVLPFSHTEGAIIELSRCAPYHEGSCVSQLWAEIVGLIGREILRRSFAEARQHEAESVCAAVRAEATLGRYMVEMRHNVNNALTSVLGNAELLTLEPGLPANVLDMADTIGNMALRLHEIFQRFSSIEKELSVAARESGKAQVRVCAAGR